MANTLAAIMALPGPLENIRLVGDEDKHATLLFFGETSLLPDGAKDVLTESVKTACDMLFPFSEAIRDVSRLGTENPPALVAMLTDQNLSQIRNLFMMNPAVKGYLSSAPQHPSFTPHITLGHPDFADEVILRALAKQLYRVNFDRLAVWWNDEQIEYPLSQIVEGDAMAMSEAIENVLEHQAVKLGKKKGTKNHVLFIARGDKPKIGDQFSHMGQPHTVIGVSTAPNDAKRHMVTAKPIPKDKVKHVEWETYELGESDVDDVLEHHGVKGQKWGVRRSVNPSTGLVARTSSADQIHTDRIASKIAKGGTSAASNKDLQDLTRRIQLENDFKRISTSPEAAKSRSWINNFVRRQSANQLDRVANKAVDIAVEHAIKKAGVSFSKKNPVLGESLVELSGRLAPKKKGGK